MVPPTAADVLSDLPTYATVVASLRSDHSSDYNRAVFDPSRSLVSAVAASLGVVHVGAPYGNGLAGVMNAIGMWMLDAEGHVWQVLLHDNGASQHEWSEHGQRMLRAQRAPWRWMPGHDRIMESLAVRRSVVLDSALPQTWDGSIEDVIAERAMRDEPWAGEDLSGLLGLWTSARMAEGQSAESARLLLALRLPAPALSNPVVARWRAGETDGDLQDMLLLGLA